MVKSSYYNLTQPSAPEATERERISDLLGNGVDAGMLWVDISGPTNADIDLLKSEFGIHPLALEDVLHGEQRPKLVDYDDYIFFVLYELDPVADAEQPDVDAPRRQCVRRGAELHLFVGRNFFISVHDGSSRLLEHARRRWERMRDQQKLGPYLLLYLVLDTVTDNYFPALDRFDERVEKLEDRITMPGDPKLGTITQSDREALGELVTLRHNLVMMRRVVTPLRDAVNILLRNVESVQERPRGESDGEARARRATALFAYFQDVYDHAIRIVDSIDTYRDILSGLVDANLAVSSNRTNEIMKVLTSVSIILMSDAFVTGLYGMNFAVIPELHWHFGYPYAISLMLFITWIEWRYFRKRRWI